MKMLPTHTEQKASEMDLPPVTPAEPVNWQLRHNQLQARFMKVSSELNALKYPKRTPEQLEADMRDVHAFLDSMVPAEGAVNAAGFYGPAFFERERDTAFVVKLCAELVRRYTSYQSLIQSTYDLWTAHAS